VKRLGGRFDGALNVWRFPGDNSSGYFERHGTHFRFIIAERGPRYYA
jgi:hypothetical protein